MTEKTNPEMSEDLPEEESETSEKKICKCGYEDNSFACKIRHVAVNYDNLRRERG